MFGLGLAGMTLGARVITQHRISSVLDGLGNALDGMGAGGCTVGFCLVDMANGHTVYALEPDRPLACASVRKLFLIAAALIELGGEFRLITALYAPGNKRGESVGPLCLKGVGDPLLDLDDVRELAKTLATLGVTQIKGSVVGDGSLFTPTRLYGADLDLADLSNGRTAGFYTQQLRGQVAGLSVGRGARHIVVLPARSPGFPAIIKVEGDGEPFILTNDVKTVLGDTNCRAYRVSGTSEVFVEGAVGMGRPWTGTVGARDPAIEASMALRRALLEAGVKTAGPASSRMYSMDPLPGVRLAEHAGIPLQEYVRILGRDSDSLLAESLVRTLGVLRSGRGDVAEGCSQEEICLRRANLFTSRGGFVDGSGLDGQNKASPADVCQLLVGMFRRPEPTLRSAFMDALPVSGESGTLKDRLNAYPVRGRVRAKTGTLKGVGCLSGFLQGVSEREYAFSLMIDSADDVPTGMIQTMIDRTVTSLVASL